MPLRVPGLALGEWWRRLFRTSGGEPPPLGDQIVPVVLLGDHRRLVPELPVPVGHSGFNTVGIAGFPSWYQLTSLSPGGIMVRAFGVASGQAVPGSTHDVRFQFRIAQVDPPAAGGLNSLTPGRPCLSRASSSAAALPTITGFVGDVGVLSGGTHLSAVQIACPAYHFNPGIWIPPGFSLLLNTVQNQTGMQGWVLFDELPAQGDA